MDADEDEGVAPAAGRPAPFPEVLPQAGLERHGGIGYELVLANAVPQLGVELDTEQFLVARVVSLWSQGMPMDKMLQEALSGEKDRVELEEKEEEREKEKAKTKTRITQVTAVASERKIGKGPRVIPPRRISERIERQIDDVPGQGTPLTRTSERIQEQTVVPGLQSIPQKRTSKRIVEQNADVSEPQVIPQKRISKRTVEQNAEDSVIPQKRISERIVEQNVDDSVQIIFLRSEFPSELRGTPTREEALQAPQLSSWTLRSGWGKGVFALFPWTKKVRRQPRSRVRTCCRTRARGRRRLMSRISRPWGRSSLSSMNALRGGAGGTQIVSCFPGGWPIRVMGSCASPTTGCPRGSWTLGVGTAVVDDRHMDAIEEKVIAGEELILKSGVPAKRLYSDRTHMYIASSRRCWPDWLEDPHQHGEGSDLPPIHFTPGLDFDASNKFEEEGHKMEEADKSVRGGGRGQCTGTDPLDSCTVHGCMLRVVDIRSPLKCQLKQPQQPLHGWRTWILEDPLVYPYRWLRSDLVPPAPFLVCDPGFTVGGSGVLVEPHAIDEQFRRAWMPFFCRGDRGHADLDAF